VLGLCFGFDGYAYSRNEWAYLIDNFGVTDVWEHGYNVEPVEGYPKSTIVQSAAELPDVSLVVLAPPEGRQVQGDFVLPEYVHPSGDTIYITGQNHVQFDPDFMSDRTYDTVYIPTEKHELFALIAAACVLYDRRAKQWVR
jgi:hypothetical protein